MIETRFIARRKPWDGIGANVEGALTSAEAIVKAGLDWNVVSRPVAVEGVDDKESGKFVANVRETDNKLLGIVSGRYQIVQNRDAFAFTDELIKGDVRYESAGAFANGQSVWLLARMPDFKLVGDDVQSYLVFTNSHNGIGAVRCAVTPVRVVCNNALNLAFRKSSRSWSVRHIGNEVMSRIAEARQSLVMAQSYIESLKVGAEHRAQIKVSPSQLESALREMFRPLRTVAIDKDAPRVTKERAEIIRGEFMQCYNAPDLENFRGTAWGAVNAMSDFISHSAPFRNTKDFEARRCAKIFNGHPDLDRFTQIVLSAAA